MGQSSPGACGHVGEPCREEQAEHDTQDDGHEDPQQQVFGEGSQTHASLCMARALPRFTPASDHRAAPRSGVPPGPPRHWERLAHRL